MIGPKKISDKEKKKISARSTGLESKITAVEKDISTLCMKMTAISDAFEPKLAERFKEEGIDESVRIVRQKLAFSNYNPDITHDSMGLMLLRRIDIRNLGGLLNGEAVQGHDPDADRAQKIFTEEYVREIDSQLRPEIDELTGKQGVIYERLDELTMIDAPFRQTHGKDHVLLYVASSEYDALLRVELTLSAGTDSRPNISDIPKEKAFDPTYVEQMKEEAKEFGANVYVVHNPSDKLSGYLIFRQAAEKLQEAYDEKHPEEAKRRTEREEAPEGMADALIGIIGRAIAGGLAERLQHAGVHDDHDCTHSDHAYDADYGFPPEILEELRQMHGLAEGEVIPKDKYNQKCSTCPGSMAGCPLYEEAKIEYDGKNAPVDKETSMLWN
ncbi:hypothetical protein ACFL96_13900 [Thermoproteota archaeon]